jgi:hypothetical protein
MMRYHLEVPAAPFLALPAVAQAQAWATSSDKTVAAIFAAPSPLAVSGSTTIAHDSGADATWPNLTCDISDGAPDISSRGAADFRRSFGKGQDGTDTIAGASSPCR